MTADGGAAVLRDARARGVALGAFSCYTLETARAICDAGEAAAQPVVIQAGSSSFGAVGRDALAGACLAAARASSTPVGVHLDHSRSLDEISACLTLGYSSIMVDGSHLPFEENVTLTRRAVELAHRAGAWAEGELGAIPGDEDRSVSTQEHQMTDPALAAEFVERTGVDALAVAIGNVHGLSAEPARLHLDVLRLIAEATPVPLVLHGASGVPDDKLRAAVASGVVKVNFNAELRRAQLRAVTDFLADGEDNDDVLALQRVTIAAVHRVVLDKVRLLSGNGGVS